METKEHERTNKIPIRANGGKGGKLIEMKLGENKYDTQFTSTAKKKNNLCMTCMN